jgi:deoxyadenosine/deoxycytidine kinase
VNAINCTNIAIMPIIIAIEGNIGTGKSTNLEMLESSFKQRPLGRPIIFLQEPVDIWKTIVDEKGVSILELFYGDQDTWAFAFQMMAYISRLSLLKQTIKDNPNAVIFTERSLFTDKNVFAQMLHDDGKINNIEYQIYMKWFDEFMDDLSLAGIIYMRSTPEICFGRVIKRSRPGEHIPLEYLIKCHEYHENWILHNSETDSVVIIDCDTDIIEYPSISTEWFNNIYTFVRDLLRERDINTSNHPYPFKYTDYC